jgi:DNA-binding transcriptional ArsR family regulator
MSDSVFRSRSRTDAADSGSDAEARICQSVDSDELLAALGDDYARRIVTLLSDESLPAREIVERLEVSRPTVYRRLNRLQEIGVVSSSMDYDPDGHHRQRFGIAVDRVTLSFDDEGVAVESPT